MKEWMGRATVDAFAFGGTTAYRLCTHAGGWVERFGDDLLISYKDDGTREVLLSQAEEWSSGMGVTIDRIFGKILPRQNADRVTPVQRRPSKARPVTSETRNV